MSASTEAGAAEYNNAYAAHIAAATLQLSDIRLIGTNNKINNLAAALKAAKEDKVRLLREVERKSKAAGDATIEFYATIAKLTRYDQENPLLSPIYHTTTPPASLQPGERPLTPTRDQYADDAAGDYDETAQDSQPESPVIGASRPLRDTRPMLLWRRDNK
jgi:hypothetical protein